MICQLQAGGPGKPMVEFQYKPKGGILDSTTRWNLRCINVYAQSSNKGYKASKPVQVQDWFCPQIYIKTIVYYGFKKILDFSIACNAVWTCFTLWFSEGGKNV